MSKEVVLFLLSQMETQIVVIDNGSLSEVVDASEELGRLISQMREALK